MHESPSARRLIVVNFSALNHFPARKPPLFPFTFRNVTFTSESLRLFKAVCTVDRVVSMPRDTIRVSRFLASGKPFSRVSIIIPLPVNWSSRSFLQPFVINSNFCGSILAVFAMKARSRVHFERLRWTLSCFALMGFLVCVVSRVVHNSCEDSSSFFHACETLRQILESGISRANGAMLGDYIHSISHSKLQTDHLC